MKDDFPIGQYQIILFGTAAPVSGNKAIKGQAGLDLDGEFNSTWPSGNGAAGGDFGIINLEITQ